MESFEDGILAVEREWRIRVLLRNGEGIEEMVRVVVCWALCREEVGVGL